MFQRCGEQKIVFENLSKESNAIYLAIVSSANDIAGRVVASHLDTHKTLFASEVRPASGAVDRWHTAWGRARFGSTSVNARFPPNANNPSERRRTCNSHCWSCQSLLCCGRESRPLNRSHALNVGTIGEAEIGDTSNRDGGEGGGHSSVAVVLIWQLGSAVANFLTPSSEIPVPAIPR